MGNICGVAGKVAGAGAGEGVTGEGEAGEILVVEVSGGLVGEREVEEEETRELEVEGVLKEREEREK